ncbi:MAG: DUF2235 domain-containing protein [Paracoccaceae bacterium]|nr:DUF2235 domain-containing protein [Paracoccaceae bacterium]
MKRIVILCDGTWNRTDTPTPTNVVKTAQALKPIDAVGVVQIPLYIPGVGTGEGITKLSRFADKVLGGALGWGLMENVADAYRHLVFIYEPGDEIYVFGFSRGAYTARSLTGFLRSSGIIARDDIHMIPKAVKRYRTLGDDNLHPNTDDSHRFRADTLKSRVATSQKEIDWRAANGRETVPLLKVVYLGVWDSVGALGVPAHIPLLGSLTARKYRFHDANLSSMVKSARHAIAIDEHRKSFLPTKWENVDPLNAESGSADRPYREEYFLGDHGSVGGGGDITDLSDIALEWMLDGAMECGLQFSAQHLSAVTQGCDPMGPLRNTKEAPTGGMNWLMRRNPIDRPGPDSLTEVHPSVMKRWTAEAKSPDFEPYRPKTLRNVEPEIVAWYIDQTGDTTRFA